MIANQFEYVAAKNLDEALSLLAKHKDNAKLLAGGHSLIPSLKLRLAQPQLLIDISRIKDLSYIKEEGGQIRIGAMTTHYLLESSALLKKICPLLPETATNLGDIQVRNRGTIGGSLAHSDPAADWPAAIIALSGEMVAAGPKGGRSISADKFFVDLLTTELQPGEILQEIRITPAKGKVGQAYMKVRHPASGFAMVGIAVNLVLDGAGKCQSAGVGVTGVAAKAYRASEVENALKGATLDAKTIAAAAAHAADGVEINSDLAASADYRKQLATVYTRRAIEVAVGRAK
ncbi:MAG TPA: xanthine dehydrogenase family protein subunit M [Candidatus Saccharimonadales bacterium]|jgi:carbon-monoxide dehydrogenase medium subunit|nr:xanthine dehydrogenase family protein subunit M [Candidatus Saccharimonadales bacterium]